MNAHGVGETQSALDGKGRPQMNADEDLRAAYEEARRALEETQTALRLAASTVARLQSEVSYRATVVQHLGQLLEGAAA